MVALLGKSSHPVSLPQVLMVSIPATLCGVIVAALWSIKRGKDLENDPEFLETVEREFRVQNLIKLEQNYRSGGNILNAANALIAHNAKRLGKELWTDAGEGEPVRIYEAQTDGYEAAWLVDEVKGLIAEGHVRAEIAVLYRSNAQSRVLEHALFGA